MVLWDLGSATDSKDTKEQATRTVNSMRLSVEKAEPNEPVQKKAKAENGALRWIAWDSSAANASLLAMAKASLFQLHLATSPLPEQLSLCRKPRKAMTKHDFASGAFVLVPCSTDLTVVSEKDKEKAADKVQQEVLELQLPSANPLQLRALAPLVGGGAQQGAKEARVLAPF